jgi:uncharacterized protein
MAKRKVINAIEFLRKSIEEGGIRVSQIILFGSHARGNASADSDIDVVIISEDFSGKDIFERAKLTGQAEWKTIRKFMVPFDIITMTPEELESETSIVAGFAKQGKIIFAA